MKLLHSNPRTLILGLAAISVVAACDRTPTDPAAESTPVPSGDGAEALAASTVEGSWSELVTSEELELETLRSVDEGRAPAEVQELLLEAGAFAAGVEDARRTGLDRVAQEFEALMSETYLEAALVAQGDGLADAAIAGAESTLAAVEDALGSSRPSRTLSESLERARRGVVSARTRASRGNRAGALLDATVAASELRALSPERRAREIVEKAQAFLERAIELAGPDPREEIREALDQAREECRLARAALEDEEWRTAIARARRCGLIARRVVGLLAGGVDDDLLEERALEAVEGAAAYFERAEEAAGDAPGPRIEAALQRAERFLVEARGALSEAAWRKAVHLARRSAAISRRVIAAVQNGGSGDGPVVDRIGEAVETANDLLERATALAGDDPAPAIEARLRRATLLVEEANEAFRNERWRVAFVKAQRATGILREVISRLT